MWVMRTISPRPDVERGEESPFITNHVSVVWEVCITFDGTAAYICENRHSQNRMEFYNVSTVTGMMEQGQLTHNWENIKIYYDS